MNNVNKDNTMHNDDVANVVDDGVIDDDHDVANVVDGGIIDDDRDIANDDD